MPLENRVGGDDGGDLTQQPPTQTVPAPRQPAPVFIGQAQAAAAQLRVEDPIFFNQIRDGRLPSVAPPARNGH
jgi:hypothetical protein